MENEEIDAILSRADNLVNALTMGRQLEGQTNIVPFVDQLIGQRLSRIPPAPPLLVQGPPGRNGLDGKSVTIDDVLPFIRDEISRIPIPKGKDGKNGKDGKIRVVKSLEQDSAAILFNPDIAGGVLRSVRDRLQDVIHAEDIGAAGDGSFDNTTVFNRALALGLRIWLRRNGNYLVTSRLVFASGSALLGDGTAKIYAPAASFNNTSLNIAQRYGANSSVLSIQGELSGSYTPINNVEVRGIRIESEVEDGRMVDAIVARNGTNIRITDCEIFGFPVGCGIRAASLLQDSRISRNHIHTFTDNTDWGGGTLPQITGVEIDNDLVNSIATDGLEICGNRIRDLTIGATFLAAHGYQTDGIQLNTTPVHYTINDNRIYNVGEGVDTFGSYGVIAGNVIDKCYNFGIKVIHGASWNAITGNTIRRAGVAGINLSGSNTSQTVQGNHVSDNVIYDIDPDNVWSSATTACIRSTGSGETYKLSNNHIADNVLHPGSNGKYALSIRSDGTLNSYINNRILASGASGRVDITGTETYYMAEAFKTAVRVARVSAVQSIPDATATKIEFESEGLDRRGEYDNATNYRWTCQIPGPYRVYAQTRFGTMSDGILISMAIRKNNIVVAQHSKHNGAANDENYAVSDVVTCAVGDYIEIFVTQNSGGGTARDITNNAVHTFMTIDPA